MNVSSAPRINMPDVMELVCESASPGEIVIHGVNWLSDSKIKNDLKGGEARGWFAWEGDTTN